jgi:hypothetical protein
MDEEDGGRDLVRTRPCEIQGFQKCLLEEEEEEGRRKKDACM